MKNKDHLIVINTYNKIDELNKTINSINKYLPGRDICVISKGNEKKSDIKGKIKFFYKTDNIGRESHGYIYAFLKHSNYKIYTFLQDKPYEENYGSYYGDKIKIAEELINNNIADYVTGMKFSITPSSSRLPKKIGNYKFNLNIKYKDLKKSKFHFWIFSIGACFTIKGDLLRKHKKLLKKIYKEFKKNPYLAWELELIWASFSKKNYLIDEKYNVIKNKLKLKDLFYLVYLKLLNFFR